MTSVVRVWSARRALSDPRRFLALAAHDFVSSLPIAASFAAARIKARHRRMALGYLWLVMPALALTLAFEFIRTNRIVSVGETGLPYPVFVLCGLFLWQGFVEAVAMPVAQLEEHRRLLFNLPVPHEAVLLGGCIDLAINLAVRLALLLMVLLVTGLPFSANWGLLPLAGAGMALVGLAIGLWIAPVGLLYDDVGRAIPLAAMLGIAVTPVLYPLPAGSILGRNPLAPLLSGARAWIAGGVAPASFWPILAGATVIMLAGWLFYRLARSHVASTG